MKETAIAWDDKWITVKPNGPDNKGSHILLDESGEIKAGLGGNFNGRKISEIGPNKPVSTSLPKPVEGQKKPSWVFSGGKPLDHGELNIPGRTKNLNREIDAWKRDEAKRKKAEQKQAAVERAENRTESRKAKESFKKHQPDLIKYFMQEKKSDRPRVKEVLQNTVWTKPKMFNDLISELKTKGVLAEDQSMKHLSDKIKAGHRVAFDAASARNLDANGFMHVGLSNITKATVNPYCGREIPGWEKAGLDPDKVYHGLRDAAELEKSLPTWAGLPLLFDHIVDSAEAPQKAARVGAVGDAVQWAAPYLKAPLTIWDQSAQDAVNSGQMRELSCCYIYEPDFTPGVYQGQKYDFVMRNIKGNHVALVEEGRAGPDVFVADSNIFKKGKNMDIKEAIKTILAALGLGGGSESTPPAGDNEPEKQPVASDEDVTELLPELAALVEGVDDPEKAARMKAVLDRLTPGAASDQEPDDDSTAADEGETDNHAPEMLPGPGEQNTAQDRKPVKKKVPAARPTAMDAAAIRAQARDDTLRHVKELGAAAQAMRPVLGSVDPYAYDSATDIYGAALKERGVDTAKYPRAAWRGMAEMLTANRALAQDAAPPTGGEIHPAFTGLMAITPN